MYDSQNGGSVFRGWLILVASLALSLVTRSDGESSCPPTPSMLRGLELGMYAILALCCVWVDYLLRVRDLSTGKTTHRCTLPPRPLPRAHAAAHSARSNMPRTPLPPQGSMTTWRAMAGNDNRGGSPADYELIVGSGPRRGRPADAAATPAPYC